MNGTQPRLNQTQLNELMWQFVLDHQNEIDHWCLKASQFDQNLAEDLYSDEFLRMLPKLMLRWDPQRPLYNYIKRYFALHFKKKVAIRMIRLRHSIDAIEDPTMDLATDADQVNDVASSEYYTWLLNHLEPMERSIVYRSVVLGHTCRQIAEDVPYSYATISIKLKQLLAKLQIIATHHDAD